MTEHPIYPFELTMKAIDGVKPKDIHSDWNNSSLSEGSFVKQNNNQFTTETIDRISPYSFDEERPVSAYELMQSNEQNDSPFTEVVEQKLSQILTTVEHGVSIKPSSEPPTTPSTPFSYSQSHRADLQEKFKSLISLKGTLLLRDNNTLFDLSSDKSIGDSSLLGTWDGTWGMNDAAFQNPNGVLSPFSYKVYKSYNEILDDDEETLKTEIRARIVITGYFNIKATDPENPYIKVEENDLLLTVSKTHNTEPEVFGSGKNKFGSFRLYGSYIPETATLNCYREYTPQAPKTRVKPIKRKTSEPKLSTMKRPRAETAGPLSTPISDHHVDSMSAHEFTSGMTNGNLSSNEAKAKRARKTPSHLKDSLNIKTLRPIDEPEERTESDWDAMSALLNKIISADKERWFIQPVDAQTLGLTNYHDIIKVPMDLGTVRARLDNNRYSNFNDIINDIRLVFRNAMVYNPARHPVHTVAAMHLKLFEKDLKIWDRERTKRDKKRKHEADVSFAGDFSTEKHQTATLFKDRKEFPTVVPDIAKMQRDKEINDRQQDIEKQQQKLKSVHKKIEKIFSSSDDSDNSVDSEDSDDSASLKDIAEKYKDKKGKNKKKKGKKSDEQMAELKLLRKTVKMMNVQLEMMQQMQQANVMQLSNMNKELTEQSTTITKPRQRKNPTSKTVRSASVTSVSTHGHTVIPQQSKSSTNTMMQPVIQSQYGTAPAPLVYNQGGNNGYNLNPVVGTHAMSSSQGYSQPSQGTQVQKKKRELKEMSYQEKKQLGQDINKLPPEDLPEMVRFLFKEGAYLGEGDEVELDIDSLDTVMLRKLQRFVGKALAKAKGEASLSEMMFDSD